MLFALLPFILAEINLSPPEAPYHFLRQYFFVMMWVLTLGILWVRHKQPNKRPLGQRICWDDLKPVLLRLPVVTVLLAGLILWLAPERFLQFPQERPWFWLLVMVLYPLLSVFPQELIYRHFFFERYQPLFGSGGGMLLMSALAFGHLHYMFNTVVAYGLSIIGGYIFARSYARQRNLWLVCIEHSLYGQIIFTLGLGWYFYHGGAAIS